MVDDRYDPIHDGHDDNRPTAVELAADARDDARRARTPLHPIVAEQIAAMFPPIPCQDCGTEHRADCATCHPF